MKTSKIILLSALMLGLLIPLKGFAGETKKADKHTESEVIGEITTKIHGTIEKLPKNGLIGTWVVKGKKVHVTKDTHIDERHGKVAIGVFIEVEGNTKGKGIEAYEIEVEGDILVRGKIETLPKNGLHGTWIINGKKVIVNKETHIDKEYLSKMVVGSTVEVEGKNIGDSIEAYEIDLREPVK